MYFAVMFNPSPVFVQFNVNPSISIVETLAVQPFPTETMSKMLVLFPIVGVMQTFTKESDQPIEAFRFDKSLVPKKCINEGVNPIPDTASNPEPDVLTRGREPDFLLIDVFPFLSNKVIGFALI